MTTELTLPRQLTVWRNGCLGMLAALLTGCGGTLPVAPGESLAIPSLANICAERQGALTSTRLAVANVVHADREAFVLSKPGVRPLETQQYISYSDTAGKQPQMVSCKFKTADHIRAEYGATAAGEPTSCAYLNRRLLDAVLAGFTPRERQTLRFRGGTAVLIEADQMVSGGPAWLEPFEMVSTDLAGTLRIRSKSMRNDWNDPKLTNTPPQFKGTLYCHLIAPDHLRRLLLGTATPGQPPAAAR